MPAPLNGPAEWISPRTTAAVPSPHRRVRRNVVLTPPRYKPSRWMSRKTYTPAGVGKVSLSNRLSRIAKRLCDIFGLEVRKIGDNLFD